VTATLLRAIGYSAIFLFGLTLVVVGMAFSIGVMAHCLWLFVLAGWEIVR
jgi:hypothetical protein